MSGGAGTYVVTNNQVGDLTFQNSDGLQVSLLPGSAATATITASVWSNLIALVGASNVVAVVSNPTYKYAVLGVTPVAAPTDFLVIQGSATKTINITKIRLYGAATPAQGALPFQVVRRSTAGTLGSATLTAVVPALTDIKTAAPTAVVSYVQTANYGTLGTLSSVIEAGRLGQPIIATGTAGDGQAVKMSYSDVNDQPIRLRGTSDFVCINFAGGTVIAGGIIDFAIELYEDNS